MSWSTGLLVLGVLIAVAAGLYVGSETHRQLEARSRQRRSASARVRDAARKGAFRLWKWSRNRDDS